MENYPKILSIMEDYLGHRTYGETLRKCLTKNSSCDIDFYWYKEEREIPTRVLNRLLSFYFPNLWIQKQNLDFHRFRIQAGFSYMAKRLATRRLSNTRYTAIHFHTQNLGLLSTDLMKKLPTVVSLDLTGIQASQERTHPSFRWTYNPNIILEKRVFEAAAQIVTWSESTRCSVITDYKIDEEKTKVVYPGVDITVIIPPERLDRDVKNPYKILFVGGDFQRKGGQDLLDVFLTRFANAAELHLVTSAPVKCEHPHVHVHNNVKAYTPKWLDLYRQADVFVLPTYNEAFGFVFIEAMAAGLPVVATRINAIPEIVSHGETGFLIQPGDRHQLACRIRDLMENSLLGREMGAKGRKVVEQKFNAQTNFQTLASIFKDVAVPN